MEKGYCGKLVRTQILKARDKSRVSLLERGNTRTSESKLTFNMIYCTAFQNVRLMHIIRTSNFVPPDKEYKMVFTEVPIVGFRNSKKDYLVRAALPKIDNTEGPEASKKATCQVCDHIITTKTFTTKACGEVFKIPSGSLNCNLEKFITFQDAKFVMILHMLERLKQSSTFGLIIIKAKTDLFEKENRINYKIVFIHTMYKIATKILTTGNSIYLRGVKRTSILKKGKHFGNTN